MEISSSVVGLLDVHR